LASGEERRFTGSQQYRYRYRRPVNAGYRMKCERVSLGGKAAGSGFG
jgi:hypothetical protein